MQGRRRIGVATSRPGLLFTIVFLGTLLLDQASKIMVRGRLLAGQTLELIEGVLAITYVRNTGAAFGLMPGRQYLFIAVAAFVLVAVAIYWRRTRPRAVFVVVALGLVAAGAIGNLLDRLLVGRVTDFIDVFAEKFPVFNVADSALIVGVGLLMIWVAMTPDGSRAEEPEAEVSAAEPEAPAKAEVQVEPETRTDAETGALDG